jgi:hypothetical protein
LEIPSGNYKFYAYMYGKSHFLNKISAPISVSVQ